MSLEHFNPILSAYISCAHNFQDLKQPRVKVRLTLGWPRCGVFIIYIIVPKQPLGKVTTEFRSDLSSVWNNAWTPYAHPVIHLQTPATSTPGNPFKQARRAGNWIATCFFKFFTFTRSLHVRQQSSLCSLLRDELIQLWTPERRGGGISHYPEEGAHRRTVLKKWRDKVERQGRSRCGF